MESTSPLSTGFELEQLTFAASDGVLLSAGIQPGRGVPLLLAHGFGQTRESWLSTQSRLAAAGHPSLAWDMRGHGRSGRNPADAPYHGMQFVDDHVHAAALLEGMPVLVGASMGGLTGLLAQSRHRLYSALVLVDVTPRWEEAGMERIHAFMKAFPRGFDSPDQAADAIAGYLPQRRVRKTPAQLSTLLRPMPDGRLHWHWDQRLLDEFIAGSGSLQQALSDAASAIDVPVLLISGGRSDLVSERTISHFLELVPHARHASVPHATHMVAGDDNDAFADTLLEFLRAQFPGNARLASVQPGASLFTGATR